jgi:hypothetical protein
MEDHTRGVDDGMKFRHRFSIESRGDLGGNGLGIEVGRFSRRQLLPELFYLSTGSSGNEFVRVPFSRFGERREFQEPGDSG